MTSARVKFQAEEGDLQILQDRLVELGCQRAGIIKVADLRFRESVRRKCEYPNCGSYGNTFQCPPFAPKKEQMASCVSHSYEYGVVGVIYSSKEVMAIPADGNVLETFANAGEWSDKLNNIVGKIESKAHELGYYKAMGFNCGPCVCCGMWTKPWFDKVMTGQDAANCMVIRNGICRTHRRARPSAEPLGIDIVELIKRRGWAPEDLIFPEMAAENVPECLYYAFVLAG
ncbi:MAG: hypothetical protein HY801_04280 [Candidatus Lindowbacteria bacterium]|nr:hypothetical protein [Candidatus Lindowbacteria bacterium]